MNRTAGDPRAAFETMRIALLARRIAPDGGMEAHAAWLARTLAARGHDVTVVTASPPTAGFDLEAQRLTVARVESPITGWSTAWYSGAARIVEAIRPDLVVAESTAAGPIVDRWPTVTQLYGNHWNELAGIWSVWGRRRARHAVRRTAALVVDYVRWRPRRIAHGAVVALTERDARRARLLYGVPAGRVTVLANPVSKRFTSVRMDRQRRIVFAGRLDPGKGPELLIPAFAQSRGRELGYTLEFAGDGPLRSALTKGAQRAGIEDAVVFHGRLGQSELAELLGSATVACFPSVRRESFSIALIEALAAGCAVICSEPAGLQDVIDHPLAASTSSAPGTIVREHSARAWSAAMNSLICDSGATASQSAAGRLVASGFDEDRIASALEQLYRSVAAAADN